MMDGNPITEELKRGRENARKKPIITTNELPVYRLAANVLYLITDAVARAPRKLARLTDSILLNGADALKAIAMANEARGAERAWYLSMANADFVVMRTHLRILVRQNVMNENAEKKIRVILKNIGAQIAGWRDASNRGGRGEPKGGRP